MTPAVRSASAAVATATLQLADEDLEGALATLSAGLSELQRTLPRPDTYQLNLEHILDFGGLTFVCAELTYRAKAREEANLLFNEVLGFPPYFMGLDHERYISALRLQAQGIEVSVPVNGGVGVLGANVAPLSDAVSMDTLPVGQSLVGLPWMANVLKASRSYLEHVQGAEYYAAGAAVRGASPQGVRRHRQHEGRPTGGQGAQAGASNGLWALGGLAILGLLTAPIWLPLLLHSLGVDLGADETCIEGPCDEPWDHYP